MKPFTANPTRSKLNLRAGEQAGTRMVVHALIFFLMGIGAGAFLIYRGASLGKTNESHDQGNSLTQTTRTILKGLDSPVEIRFYSLLDPASVGDASQAFSKRVDQLLSEYQTEAGGKVNVVRINSPSDANADAASADGIKPFNMDKGVACYLGIAISHNAQKESLPRLDPDWEPALEFDLARAIVRVSNASSTTKSGVAANTSQPDKTAIEEVKRLFPNVASVPLDEGTQILRAKAASEFSAAAGEMAKKITAAQEKVVQAQSNGSESAQQAAMKEYEQLQTEQTAKLKQIAAQAQQQIQAWEQLKKQ